MATVCNISRNEFAQDAKAVVVTIEGVPMIATPKQFSTGSLGWNINNKAQLKIGDKTVTVQVGLNLTIVGSKDAAP
jgi:hypothetical protein